MTESQIAALEYLQANEGSVLLSKISERTERDVFSNVVPGISVFRKLDKMGLVLITEEEPIEDMDGFCFTPMIEITDRGREELKKFQQ